MTRFLVALVLMVSTANATAQQLACAPRAIMLKVLLDKYHESPVVIGLAGKENVMTLTLSLTGTWSMIVTKKGGETCIIAAGTDWMNVGVALAPGKDS